jgi:hypothetical protein
MTGLTDDDLYDRGARTLVASWEAYARGCPRAAVIRSVGVAVAVFPDWPERALLNNALLGRGLDVAGRARALTAMQAAYAAAGITCFAAWVHESDQAMREDLAARGYTAAESTRAMGMALSDIRLPRPTIELAVPDWAQYLRIIGVPPGFARRAGPSTFRDLGQILEHAPPKSAEPHHPS